MDFFFFTLNEKAVLISCISSMVKDSLSWKVFDFVCVCAPMHRHVPNHKVRISC